MRVLICAGSLSLIVVVGAAYAQPVAQPSKPNASSALTTSAPKVPADSSKSPGKTSVQDEIRAQFTQCMKDWDARTHMTKQDWERTCRRVTQERTKYLREHGYLSDRKKSQDRAK